MQGCDLGAENACTYERDTQLHDCAVAEVIFDKKKLGHFSPGGGGVRVA